MTITRHAVICAATREKAGNIQSFRVHFGNAQTQIWVSTLSFDSFKKAQAAVEAMRDRVFTSLSGRPLAKPREVPAYRERHPAKNIPPIDDMLAFYVRRRRYA